MSKMEYLKHMPVGQTDHSYLTDDYNGAYKK